MSGEAVCAGFDESCCGAMQWSVAYLNMCGNLFIFMQLYKAIFS